MTTITEYVLRLLAQAYLRRFRPQIVAVTGNAGKTTTKEAIVAVLATQYRVRATGGNLNTPLGIPATIIGDSSEQYYRGGSTPLFWLSVFFRGVKDFLRTPESYPQVLVLEYGADKPGDIARMARRFPPHISVVTQIGPVPVHVEFFASPQHLAQEKMQIIKHLDVTDHAVLNYDDQTVLDMRSHTRAQVHTFGLGEGAEVQATHIIPRVDGLMPLGLRFDVMVNGHMMPAVVNGTVGRGMATACAAAVAVGQILHVGLADAVGALARLKAPAGRMRILRGIKETVIIDDTYNASPAAMHLALETVKNMPAQRRVLVLGDMLELGEHTISAHQALGDMAGDIADVLVCVGERTRFVADSAANQMPQEHIHWFHDSIQAAPKVQELIRPGDLILVKGSQGKRMERIVREIMAEPQRARELLVRQSARWLTK